MSCGTRLTITPPSSSVSYLVIACLNHHSCNHAWLRSTGEMIWETCGIKYGSTTSHVGGMVVRLWPPKHIRQHPCALTPSVARSPYPATVKPCDLLERCVVSNRPLPGAPDRGYRTDLWVTASDLALNLPRNRYVLYFGAMGFQAFTLLVQFEDTPEGLVVSVEVVLGAAALGYDKKNPIQGVPKPVAAAANAMLFETVMKPYRDNGDYNAAMDAVTRHVVEEFSNMQRFVPLAWEQQGPGAVLKQLQEFASTMSAATSKLPLAQLARAYMYKTYSASLAGQ